MLSPGSSVLDFEYLAVARLKASMNVTQKMDEVFKEDDDWQRCQEYQGVVDTVLVLEKLVLGIYLGYVELHRSRFIEECLPVS